MHNVIDEPGLLRRESLTDQTARAIREAILNRTYALGQKLRESELAARFGASSSVIREALHLLQGEGLVTTRPYCGRSVFSVQPEEAKELVIVRASLESHAAYLAAKKVTPAAAERIVTAADRMTVFPPTNHGEWVDRELSFHSAIWAVAGNEWLIRQLKQVSVPVLALQIFEVSGSDANLGNVWDQAVELEKGGSHRGHKALARVIASGDAPAARRLMVQHLAHDLTEVSLEMFGV